MKIKMLISTMDSQGARADDFCYAPEGEPVWFPLSQCENDQCGCHRSMTGFFSRHKTTTFKIELVDLKTAIASVAAMATNIFRLGFEEMATDYARSALEEIHQIGRRFNEGDILEVQQNEIWKRSIN